MLAGEKCRTAGRAGLLAVIVQELHPLPGQPVDVGRVEAHDSIAVATEVRNADVVAEDHQNVWFFRTGHFVTCSCFGLRKRGAAARLIKGGRSSNQARSIAAKTTSGEPCNSGGRFRVCASPPQREEGWPKAGVVWSSCPSPPNLMEPRTKDLWRYAIRGQSRLRES